MSSGALISFEIRSIQRYVFASTRMRDIVGASRALDALGSTVIPKVVGDAGKLILNAGGVAWIYCPDAPAEKAGESARRVAARIVQATRRQLGPVDISLSITKGDLSFGTLERAADEARRARRRWSGAVQLGGQPLASRCVRCGEGVAGSQQPDPDGRKPDPDGRSEDVCDSCALKSKRRRSLHRVEGDLEGVTPGLLEPRDFEAVAGEGRQLALVVADANRMGERLQNVGKTLKDDLTQLAAYTSAVDETLRGALNAALKAALPDALKDARPGASRPYQLILFGGDDIVIATRGRIGLPLAMGLANAVDSLAAKRPLRGEPWAGLSISVAVVVAHVGTPFLVLHEVAERLLASAKLATRPPSGESTPDVSAVNFLRLSGSHVSPWTGTARDVRFERPERPLVTVHSGKPYLGQGTLSLDRLTQGQSLFAEVPRSRRYELAARTSIAAATARGLSTAVEEREFVSDEYDREIKRLEELGGERAELATRIRTFFKEWAASSEVPKDQRDAATRPPWIAVKNWGGSTTEYRNPIPDLIEALEMSAVKAAGAR